MKELKILVNENISEAFYEFCSEHGTDPDNVIQSLVNLYGRVQIDMQKAKEGKLSIDSASQEANEIMAEWLDLASHRFTALPYPLFLELESNILRCLGLDIERDTH